MEKVSKRRKILAFTGKQRLPSPLALAITRNNSTADFIIADITERSPNVLYELGIAHALAKPVVILTQTADDVPFDLGSRRILIYGDYKKEELPRILDNAITEIMKEYGWVVDEVTSANQETL